MKFSYSIKQRITPRNKFIVEYCGAVSGRTVLDIGCSYGWLEQALLAKKVKRIMGIESTEGSFYNAKKEVPKAEFKVGSASKIPYSDKTFDMVVFLEVLEHVPKGEEDDSFKEIFRVLKKGGKLILSTPNSHFLSCLLDPVWYFGHRHYKVKWIVKMLKENGFEVREVFLYGKFWELVRMLPHYFFKWVLKMEDPLKEFFFKRIENDGKDKDGYAYIYLKATKK